MSGTISARIITVDGEPRIQLTGTATMVRQHGVISDADAKELLRSLAGVVEGDAWRVRPQNRQKAADAVSEAGDDLDRLMEHARHLYSDGSEYVDVATSITGDILGDPLWGRLELVTVLAAAVAGYARFGGTG